MLGDILMKNYNVGFLCGTFDLFHTGHLKYIKKASQYCRKLVVGINSDVVVKSYKDKYPIISCKDRINIVKSIKYVYNAIELNSRDKTDAHKRVKFDVLFMSEQWRNSEYYMDIELEMSKLNVDVIWLPYTPEISTTQIINRILKQSDGRYDNDA